MAAGSDFPVSREDLRRTRFAEAELPDGAALRSGGFLLEIERRSGRDDVEAVYRRTLDGDLDPAVGQMLSLHE